MAGESSKSAIIVGCATIMAAIITVVGTIMLQRQPVTEKVRDETDINKSSSPIPIASPDMKPATTPTPNPLLNLEVIKTGDLNRDGIAEKFVKECPERGREGSCSIYVFQNMNGKLIGRLVGDEVVFTESYHNGYRDLIITDLRGDEYSSRIYEWNGETYTITANIK